MPKLHRLAAFSDDPHGGNPAGVWVGKALPDDQTMLRIAAKVGYSETVFAAPTDNGTYLVRYFSPEREVAFCGHATIALGAQLGEELGMGRYLLDTRSGIVPVVASQVDGTVRAKLISVDPSTAPASTELVAATLATLSWSQNDVDPSFVPAVAFAGARHLLLSIRTRKRLASVTYDFETLRDIMLAEDLTTVDLFWQESAEIIHSRNLFPVGGVIEDPATGAAAAALGGHLRIAGLIDPPAEFVVHQGVDMGRPALLHVSVPATGGIEVSGSTVPIE